MKKDIVGPRLRDIELRKMTRAIDQTTSHCKPTAQIVTDILSHPLFPHYLQHMHGLLGITEEKSIKGVARLISIEQIIRTQVELDTNTQLHSDDFYAALNYVRRLKVS